jgi:hypothetical protein
MNKKCGEITLLTERQQAVFAAPIRESELQTTQHTTPPTELKEIIIYSKAVEDFKHFATETSVHYFYEVFPNGFKFGKCFLQYSFECLSFLSPNKI